MKEYLVNFQCNKCGKVFTKKWLLKRHKRDESECVCDKCDKVWCNSRDLQKHRHSVHGVSLNAVTEKFQCDNCGQELSRKVMLERHQRNASEYVLLVINVMQCVVITD